VFEEVAKKNVLSVMNSRADLGACPHELKQEIMEYEQKWNLRVLP
jgi:hypothetical protein